MTREEFNGYMFDNPNMRKEMKYLIVEDGDLDTNNCYSFMSKADLFAYVSDSKESYSIDRIQAIFEISDVTNYFKNND